MRKLYVKSLNDGTQGFRFRVFGFKGLTRKRQNIKRWGVSHGSSMTAYHMGKRSLYVEGGMRQRQLGETFAG